MATLERRKLRAAGGPLDLTVLGFGGVPLGNLFAPVSDAVADSTLDAAWDAGIRIFDTAPFYGFGLSEQRFGRRLRTRPRAELVLSTKIGRVLRECGPGESPPPTLFKDAPQRTFDFDYSYDGVMRSHEDSLTRLGLDGVDILLVHDVDVWTHGSKEKADKRIRELFDAGGYRALEELRDGGTIRAFGVGVNEWQICEKLLGLGDFDCFLLAGRYTLLEQEALDSFLPLCEQRDVGVILGGPFNSGILATGAMEGATYDYKPAPADILARVGRIEAVCLAHGVKIAEAALQFVLGHPVVKTVIPGGRTPAEVAMNARLLSARIPPALWSDLKAEKLIRNDAPVPDGAARTSLA